MAYVHGQGLLLEPLQGEAVAGLPGLHLCQRCSDTQQGPATRLWGGGWPGACTALPRQGQLREVPKRLVPGGASVSLQLEPGLLEESLVVGEVEGDGG